MRALAAAFAFVLLVVPGAGCLQGDTQVSVDPEEPGSPCFARNTWSQLGLFETIGARGEHDPAREGMTFDANATQLPEGIEVHSVRWTPSSNATVTPPRFAVSSARGSEHPNVVTLQAWLPDDEDTEAMAERFVANVTDEPAQAVEAIAEELLASQVTTRTQVDRGGNETNVSVHRTDREVPLAIEDLLDRLPSLDHRRPADLDDLALDAGPWQLSGELPVVRATVPLAEPYVQVTANPFDEVAVEVPIEDADERPAASLVNETFAQLDLPEPEPDRWRFDDTCGVDVERPDASDGRGGR